MKTPFFVPYCHFLSPKPIYYNLFSLVCKDLANPDAYSESKLINLYSKLRLNRGNIYELAIGTHFITKMLVDFIRGECIYKSLGKEQGEVEKWDDFIVQNLQSDLTHFQIKNQHVDFSKKPITRDRITKKERKGQLSDLSEFDETIKALLTWHHNTPDPLVRKKKKFILAIPFDAINIKEDLPLADLAQLCNEEIKPLTTVQGLEALAAKAKKFQSLYEWLQTWCGFSTWAEVLEVFSLFKVKAFNDTDEIKKHTEELLQPYFNQVETVRLLVEDIITTDNNFTTITPTKYVLSKVRHCLRENFKPWSKYLTKEQALYVSGMQDLNDEGEYPTAIMNGLWNSSRPADLYLRMPISWRNSAVRQSLGRVCLHMPSPNTVFSSESAALAAQIIEEVGGTIGTGELEAEELSIREMAHIKESAVERELAYATDQTTEAERLSVEMCRLTWEKIKDKVARKIAAAPTSLMPDLERRWIALKSPLDTDLERRRRLFRAMMHPQAERRSIPADLRVGLATASLLAHAIYFQLVILTAMGAPEQAFEGFAGIRIQTVALQFWSGPMETTSQHVRKLSKNSTELMGKERCEILIMPQVELPREALLRNTLASTAANDPSIAGSHRPTLVITAAPAMEQWIDDANLTAISAEINRFITLSVQPSSETI